MSTTTADIDAIRERLALTAHFGDDWTYDDHGDGWTVSHKTDHPQAGHLATVADYAEAVADLIVNAPADIAALLDEVDRLTRELAQARQEIRTESALVSDARHERDAARAEASKLRRTLRSALSSPVDNT